MKRKISVIFMCLILALIVTPMVKSSAKSPSAKALLREAVEEMKSHESISFIKDTIINRDGASKAVYQKFTCVSNSKYDYQLVNDVPDDYGWDEGGWQAYRMDGYEYRQDYSRSSWKKYSNYDLYKSDKSSIEFDLTHYKKASISSESSKYYVIKITPQTSDAGWTKAYVSIRKTTGRITKIKYTLGESKHMYLDSRSTYTIIGGTYTYSNITYGDTGISLPDEVIS